MTPVDGVHDPQRLRIVVTQRIDDGPGRPCRRASKAARWSRSTSDASWRRWYRSVISSTHFRSSVADIHAGTLTRSTEPISWALTVRVRRVLRTTSTPNVITASELVRRCHDDP